MAKVELPSRKMEDRRLEASEPSEVPENDGQRTTARRRWWPRLLLLVLAGVGLLPSALSIFGQVPAIIARVHPGLAQAVQFRTISLHWWAPVEITGVIVRDLSHPDTASDVPAKNGSSSPAAAEPGPSAQDVAEPLLQIARVRTSEPLWKIIASLGRGTSVVLTEPQLNLIVDEGQTNLQQTLTAVFGDSASSEESTFPLRMTVQEGTLTLQSPAWESKAAVNRINATFSSLNPAALLPEVQLTAQVEEFSRDSDTARTSDTRATSRSERPAARMAARLDELTTDFSVMPLQSLSEMPGAGSATEVADGDASESSNLQILVSQANGTRQAVRLATRQLDLRFLQPLLNHLETGWQCEGQGGCDLEAELAGPTLGSGLASRWLIQGQQVRLRQSTWSAGEWLELGETTASGAMAIAEDGILLNQLELRSAVLEATGTGELRTQRRSAGDAAVAEAAPADQSVAVQGTLNLAALAGMLPRTIHLHQDVTIQSGNLTFDVRGALVAVPDGGTTAIGATVTTEANTDATTEQRVARWQGAVQNDRIMASRGGQPVVLDSIMRLEAAGPMRGGVPEIAQVRLTADFGTMDCRPEDAGYRLSGQVRPQQLWQQLQQFLDVPQPGLTDDLQFSTLLTLKLTETTLTDLQVISRDLRASSPGIRINHLNPPPSMVDGTLHLEGSGAAIRTLISPWYSAFWLAERSQVMVDLSASAQQPLSLSLKAVVQPDVVAAAPRAPVRSVARQQSPQPWPARPVGQGPSSGASSGFIVDEARLELQLARSGSGNMYDIRSSQIQLPGLAAAVTGTVATIGAEVELDLTADTQYDLDVLSQRLLAPDATLRLSGRGRDTFQLMGSPALFYGVTAETPRTTVRDSSAGGLTPLRAVGGLTWASGTLWGLTLGPGTVRAVLENGLLKTQPVQCRLHTGEIHIMPQLDLRQQRLQLATGSRVENISLTPEFCRDWLAWMVPLMADTTRVSGRVSGRVERFDCDLNSPEYSDVAAVVTIHEAAADPGPSLQPLLEAIDVLRRAQKADRSSVMRSVTMPTQDVPVQLRQGLVTHQALTLELAGYRAVSSGAVGLDHRLQMVLDISLEKANGGGDYRRMRIPVGGTIERPQPDTAALLQSLGTQVIEQKLNNQLDRQLNKLLDKF